MPKLFYKNILLNILWPIHIKSQVDSEMLALTQATLDFKTKRSHFIRRIWCNADEVSLFIFDPEKFGRNMMDNLDEAGLTDLAPVPNIFAELKFCSCQRNCKSVRCKCKKNNLTCTQIYSRTNCEKDIENLDNKELDFDLQDDNFGV